MAEFDTVLIRYGELTTKGKNRKDFIRCLDRNIRRILSDYPDLTFQRNYDRFYIRLNGTNPDAVTEKLRKVFGISSFSLTERVDTDIDVITARCLEIAKQSGKHTFKMISRRHDKSFPMNSDAINRHVAGEILRNTDMKVDVHHPELELRVEVHTYDTYLMSEKIPGAGGYPTGINGKVLLMLSGGNDSPVAAYELMKRGLDVEAIHFASPPYTSENARQKVLDLASMMSEYKQGRMKVHMVEFTKLQLEIYKAAGDPYAVTLMRRMMVRLAQACAEANGCLAIATGESLGQVASQTLESIACINSVISIPVLRPLICMDKVEIIDLSRKIGTYETSILPYEDCCTIFDPKNPVTKPTNKKAESYEKLFDYSSMIEEALETAELITVTPPEQEDYL